MSANVALLKRRNFLQLGLASAAGASALGGRAWASGSREIRRIAVHNMHTDEQVNAVYWERGAYVPDALEAVNKVLRDFRTGDVHPIDPVLLDVLDSLSAKVETKLPYLLFSGYRSPHTNAVLHERSSGVANNSYHIKGMAADIRIPGVELRHVQKAALDLGLGGVGFYPASDFVHVDVGPVRHWVAGHVA